MSCDVSPLVWEDMIPQMPPGNLPIKLLSGFEPSTFTVLWTWDKGDTENHRHTNSNRLSLSGCPSWERDMPDTASSFLNRRRGLNYNSTTKEKQRENNKNGETCLEFLNKLLKITTCALSSFPWEEKGLAGTWSFRETSTMMSSYTRAVVSN